MNARNFNKKPQCLIADASVFIGFTTAPLGKEEEFIKSLKKFFENYKDKLIKHFKFNSKEEKDNFRESFYTPSIYYMFGAFDLAVLSLIEDFEFPVQTFTPSHPDYPAEKGGLQTPFGYRVIIGPCPRWDEKEAESPNSYEERKLIKLAKDTFLKNPPLPLIGICQIEVNTSFLIGGGTTFLRCLIKAIESLFRLNFRENNIKDNNTHIIILESFSWHELTLLVFSDSFQKIAQFIYKVRNIDLAAMGFLLSRLQKDEGKENSYRADWKELLDLPDIYRLSEKKEWRKNEPPDLLKSEENVRNVCADPNFPFNIPPDYRKHIPFGTHAIFNTTTNLGFSEKLLHRDNSLLNFESNDKVYLIRRWMAKAGHDILGAKIVSGDDGFIGTTGRSDFISPCLKNQEIRFGPLSSKELINKVTEQLEKVRKDKEEAEKKEIEPPGGLLTAYSTVAIDFKEDEKNRVSELPTGHGGADEVRKKFAYPQEKIKKIVDEMRRLRFPKVVTERVVNAINLYNMGIQDNFTFSSFLELKPFLDQVIDHILNLEEGGVGEVAGEINKMVDYFEVGWRNRFSGGWRLGEISEFNLEFKGGIQQLVSAFQIAYNRLRWFFTTNEAGLAVVGGRPELSVHLGTLRMNFLDIFKPEFFAFRIGHEISEQILELCKNKNWLDNVVEDRELKEILEKLGPSTENLKRELIERLKKKNKIKEDDEWLFEKLFSDIFADICNFHNIYGNDKDLFTYWSLAGLVTWPDAWVGGKLDEKYFLLWLIRTVVTLLGKEGMKNLDGAIKETNKYWQTLTGLLSNSNIFSLDLTPDKLNTSIQSFIRQYFPDNWETWLSGVWGVAKSPLGELRLLSREKEIWLRWQPFYQRRDCRRDCNDTLIREIIFTLKEGKVYHTPQELLKPFEPFLERLRSTSPLSPADTEKAKEFYPIYSYILTEDIILLFRAYLKLLKEGSGVDKTHSPILIRKETGEPPTGEELSSNYAEYLFDPRGGSFISNPELRRKYFMWRNAFIMSLFDLSERGKFFYCLSEK